MSDAPQPPGLPTYTAPHGVPVIHPQQQKPLLKLIGKMMIKLPKMGKVAPQTIKISHKKKEKKIAYY
jgi:hypothetical protein